jgi:hypothetical protein
MHTSTKLFVQEFCEQDTSLVVQPEFCYDRGLFLKALVGKLFVLYMYPLGVLLPICNLLGSNFQQSLLKCPC